MYSETRHKLREMTDFSAFEDLCNLLLSRIGYEGIDPQGIQGRDGGKDSILRHDNTVVFHYSLRSDWESKLDEDLETVEKKIREGAFECDKFVFVTNQFLGGEKKGKKKNEVEDEYNWDFRLIDGSRIQTELDSHHLDLRKNFFGIPDDGPEKKLTDQVEGWRNKRLKNIQNGSQLSVAYDKSPSVVLHVVPRESLVGTVDIELSRDDYLKPINASGWNPKPIPNGIAGWQPLPDGSEANAYTDLYANGRIEALTSMKTFDRENKVLFNPDYFEDYCYSALEVYLEKLATKGIKTPIYVCISLLGIEGLGIGVGGFRGSIEKNQNFSEDVVKTDPVEIVEYSVDIEEVLNDEVENIWRAGGHWRGY